MRLFLLALLTTGIVSCDKPPVIDREAALRWSERSTVAARKEAATWTFQKKDKSWVSISTARCKETETGLVYEGAGILHAGFVVYPGATEVATIEEAISTASKLKGANYKPVGNH